GAHGWVAAGALARLLAEQHGLEYLDLASAVLDPAAATLLPEKLARRYEALPVRFLDQDLVLVAVSDPTNVVASDDLRLALGLNLRVAVTAAPDLQAAIERLHRPEHEAGASVFDGDAAAGASDLHFEPQAKQMVVRMRIDGVMRQLSTVPKEMQPAVTSRLKIMSELDIAERRTPQDGRMSIVVGGAPMDLRCAVLPTTYG